MHILSVNYDTVFILNFTVLQVTQSEEKVVLTFNV